MIAIYIATILIQNVAAGRPALERGRHIPESKFKEMQSRMMIMKQLGEAIKLEKQLEKGAIELREGAKIFEKKPGKHEKSRGFSGSQP